MALDARKDRLGLLLTHPLGTTALGDVVYMDDERGLLSAGNMFSNPYRIYMRSAKELTVVSSPQEIVEVDQPVIKAASSKGLRIRLVDNHEYDGY